MVVGEEGEGEEEGEEQKEPALILLPFLQDFPELKKTQFFP